jgi:hypothetical protein
VEGLLGDLLQAQNSDTAKGWVYKSKRAGSFSGAKVGYKAFKYITDRLIALKLLEVKGGWQKWSDGFDGVAFPTNHKFATRFRAELWAKVGDGVRG